MLVALLVSILVSLPSYGESPEKSASLEQQMREAKVRYQITDDYVHDWIRFPEIEGRDVIRRSNLHLRARFGRSKVVVFLASWCLPCQSMAPQLKKLVEKHGAKFTDIVFIYSGDTERDAAGFVKEYDMPGANILATPTILDNFRNPEPPGVFVADRHGWLVDIIQRLDEKKLADLDQFLELMALR